MRDILAPTRDSRSWQPNVEYGARLAALLDGTLTAAYIVPPPLLVPDIADPGVASELLEICREESEVAATAREPFVQWCRGFGVGFSSWRVSQGAELAVLQAAAKWHDLIVLARNDAGDADAAITSLGATVLRAGLPCIVLPPRTRALRLDTIAIAWKGVDEAARALHVALPLLRRAGRLVLIHGERGESADAGAYLAEAEAHLRAHSLEVQRMRIDPLPSAAGPAIVAAAEQAGADLLVMGAYGRTRFSEWLFGGATRHALGAAPMPVFLRH
jgi:nucleotide-binding universal stress UspA family protein